MPLAQFTAAKGLVSRLLPLVRSSTKKYPLREACISILRGLPSKSASTRTGTSLASQSCVSCGEAWKPQTSLPVSGLMATMLQVHGLSPGRTLPLRTGVGFPVPTKTRLSAGS